MIDTSRIHESWRTRQAFRLPWLVALGVAAWLCGNVARAEPKDERDAGFRKTHLTYKAADGERKRTMMLWYPSAVAAKRHNYHYQVGFVAPDAEVKAGTHPVVLFSHGFLGTADQVIFLMEALARQGYIVAGVNHADALVEQKAKPVGVPNFIDAKSWTDAKFRDRQEDMTALLDHLLAENRRRDSFLYQKVDEKNVGAMGHSLGGYTVLGLSGAWESWRDKRIRAALLLAPYTTPYLANDKLGKVSTPVMIQAGTLDFGITPFLPSVYAKLNAPKYYLVLKNETHFGWTNLISLGKTTIECVKSGNAELMTKYSIAFFDHHLRGAEAAMLQEKNGRLESYQFKVK